MQRFATTQTRAEVSGNTLAGHAAVFGQTARIGSHYEQLDPSAFDETLARDDVAFLVEHDTSKLLGRTASGTLSLWTDDKGLAFEVELPDTQLGHDVKELVRRGDLTGMSFGFIPGEDKWVRASDGRQLNIHTNVRRLVETSVVTIPAYSGTAVTLRSIDITPRPTPVRARLLRARLAQYK